MTKPLTPAAQAVMDACTDAPIQINWATKLAAAAALRAAADQFFTDWDGMCCAEHLKSIAAELEAQ